MLGGPQTLVRIMASLGIDVAGPNSNGISSLSVIPLPPITGEVDRATI